MVDTRGCQIKGDIDTNCLVRKEKAELLDGESKSCTAVWLGSREEAAALYLVVSFEKCLGVCVFVFHVHGA